MKKSRRVPSFFMVEEKNANDQIVMDLTDVEEVRKAIIASEILTPKY